MTVYIDESGDAGMKFEQGSSTYFVLGMVKFASDEAREEAIEKILSLKKTLKLAPEFEFHFNQNSNNVRNEFLEVLKRLDFEYSAVAINKKYVHFANHKELYIIGLQALFGHSELATNASRIVFDDFFKRQEIHAVEKAILAMTQHRNGQKVKIHQKNSLFSAPIQIADYIAGIINRWITNKEGSENFKDKIRQKQEIFIEK